MSNNRERTIDSHWEKWMNNRDPLSGDILVNEYKPLVQYHVQRIRARVPRSVSQDELMSLGLQGLFDALTKFNRKRDLKFDTYASFRIRGSIIDGLRKEDWLSRASRERTKRLDEAIQHLEQQYQRHVEPEEIAAHLDWTVDDVYEVTQERYFSNVLSIDEKVNQDDDDTDHQYFIEDEQVETPESKVMKNELIQELIKQIETLNKNEQMVLQLFYSEDMTLTEIGEILELSTSRISQIHSKALLKLKDLLAPEVIDGGVL